jgi:hypothetical protein
MIEENLLLLYSRIELLLLEHTRYARSGYHHYYRGCSAPD